MKRFEAYRLCYMILLLIFISLKAVGLVDRNIRFTHFTNNEGLPGNTVYSICQDYKGFIWVATKNGLCKYDGQTISLYDIQITGGERLLNGQIRQVFEDTEKRLWVVAQKGVNLYNREKDTFEWMETDSLFTYRKAMCQTTDGSIYLVGTGAQKYNEQTKRFETVYLENGKPITGNVTAVTAGTGGSVWIGRASNGLICLDTQTNEYQSYEHNPSDPQSLLSDRIIALYTDKKGNIWVGTETTGVCHIDVATRTFKRIHGFPDNCVRAFTEDANGEIWIGTENGLFIYTPSTGQLANHKQNYNDRYSLSDNAIYTIFRDNENNMLIGTYFGGINIFPNLFRQFFQFDYGYTDKHLSGKAVRQIIGDKQGNLWIATEDGGFNYYNQTTGMFEHFLPEPGKNSLSYYNVHTVLLDSSNNLWIGTYLGGLNKYDLKTKRFTHYSYHDYPELIIDNLFCLLEDQDQQIWVGTTNGLTVYDPQKKTFQRFRPEVLQGRSIDCLMEDSEKNIWIVTQNNGVYCYEKTTGALKHFTYQADGNGLSDNFTNYIMEDSDRNIWIATHDNGLCKYNRQSESFSLWTKKDGLPSNTIYSIIESNSGNLWISTSNGLSCLDINDYTFTNYSISEGLPNKQFNYNSAYKAPDGMLYFGTINGMVAFHPDQLQTIKNIAQVRFSALKVFGKTMHPGDPNSPLNKNIDDVEAISLNNEQAKSFTLDFTVPTLSHPNSTFFAIRLNNEKAWSYLGRQNHVTYANLPPGEYVVHVKAAFNNKWTGDEPVRSLKVIIIPPFWQSTRAYILYTASLIILGFILYILIKRRQEEKKMILAERLEKEKTREINALKLNFFTNISHELRTPLSLILTPLQSYLDKNLFAPEIKPRIKQVADNAQRMANLMDELILFTKIETKQETIKVKQGDLSNFIGNICEGFHVLAEEKGLIYTIHIARAEEDTWFAPVKVEKIVFNLLSNAFKYTEEGNIHVAASYKKQGDYQYLRLTVSDTGIGITEDQKDKIFENYYQVKDYMKGKKTGFGIGLTLVRELVGLHKGDIRVDSQIGKGSTFTVTINVSASAFAPEEILLTDEEPVYTETIEHLTNSPQPEELIDIRPLSPAASPHKPFRLLIVEDNKELLDTYKDLFIDTYQVLTAENGTEGYRIALEKLPDIIISDVMMPEMNGFELAEKLKSGIETCHIPLILLTARTGDEAQMEGYESGADLYIEKPFHPTLLSRQIANLIATKEGQKRRYKANEIEIIEMEASDRDKKLITEIESIIIRHLDDTNFTLNDLLKEIGIGRTLLHIKLKSLVGMSTTEFINKIRLNESLKLLAKGHNISEAAYATGFSSPNYYSRCFRKVYGKSPNEWVKGER